jgi:dTDP-4-dehydrorhamnose 3,5-epimerase-like enzyme|tara:strand:+ start:241 stop:678 length:438 start_codon:yes stop_codon:yes gene_type:complete
MKLNKPKLIKFKKFADKKGYLIPFESTKSKIYNGNKSPIKIKRIFFSSGTKGYFRGDHAHKKCSQFLVCINGKIKVETIFKNNKKIFNLFKNKNYGLLLPPMVWNRIFFIDRKSLLAVVCDYKYDNKNEYINNYERFLKLSKKND